MARLKEFLQQHRPAAVLVGIVLVLTLLPLAHIFFVIGDAWQGIIPTFTDELNFARVQTVGEGHLTDGNAYYLEHADGAPLVIFGGAWINAIPLWAGLPFNAALMLNFIIWSLIFAASLYWLLRELRIAPWLSVVTTVFVYLEQYTHVWRPVNLQPAFPFFFLFYAVLLRLMREQSRRNIIFVAAMFGITFYLFAYLWQIAAVTLGLLFLWALVRKNWTLAKATFSSSFFGALIGLPIPLYMLWLSHTSPYFWESMGRLGLVDSHLPMAEVVYSGGWIGIICALVLILLWRVPALRQDSEFRLLAVFTLVTGLALWIMQGSNLITGKQLETGEHVRRFLFPWLALASVGIGAYLYARRAQLSRGMKLLSVFFLVLLVIGNAHAFHRHFLISAFASPAEYKEMWQTQQSYAKPFAWLQNAEEEPVVIWSDPHEYFASVLPIFTRHFTLHTYFGMLELVPEGEIYERYLISQYFDNPTPEDLKSEKHMGMYLGRRDFPHKAKTIEREIKVCRILFFWDKEKDCGVPPTPQELLGDQFFIDLEKKFRTDIRPNIKAYLAKYHVSYILKDKVSNPQYHPEVLGASRVYEDERYEIYRLPQ